MRGCLSCRGLFVEQLESRWLLAAVIPQIDSTGVLVVSGNRKNDSIQISSSGAELTVAISKQSFQFNTADVASILIDGGGGNDRITIDDGVILDAVIYGGSGNDRMQGGGGDDTIYGDRGNDRVFAGSGDDVVQGGVGNDQIFGGAGLDQLFGEAGQDGLFGEGDDDQLFGGTGPDRLHGGAGNDELFGERGKDQLEGDLGDDVLEGGRDIDKLLGGDGNDLIKGGSGADSLNGGPGDDLLDGDSGRDKIRDGFEVDLDLQLVAPLARSDSSAAAGEARLTQVVMGGAVQVQFQVSVVGAALGETLNVSVDGNVIGTIDIDATSGAGTATFDPNSLAFPIDEGSLIEVGPDSTMVVIRGILVKTFA
jgi:Ca2+-binding RTX toxin-like protein